MLRPTFLGFETAKRGMATSQKGLDVTGQNMTNWDSAGYTRQRVDQVAIAPSTYTMRFASNRISVTGQGVEISGVAQIRDSFLDKRYRDEVADEGYFSQVSAILSDIESAIGEFNPLSNAGIRGCLETLLPALQQFADLPYSETNANIVKTEFSNLTQTLHQLNSKLDSVAAQQKYNLKIATTEVNALFQQIAGVNNTISQDLGLTIDNDKYGPNELFDERNLLLDQLALYGDIEVIEQEDRTVTVQMNGVTVVEGKRYEAMEMVENSNDTVSLRWLSSGNTVDLNSGALKGFTDFINGRGPNVSSVGESQYRGIPYYRDKLNTFANTLAHVVNNIVPDTYDANGDPLTYKELLGGLSQAPDANGNYTVSKELPITAGNISLSDAWTADSSYIIAKEDNKDNNYVLQMYNALTLKDQSFVCGSDIYYGTFYDFVDDYAATLAEDYTFYNGRYEASATITAELQDRRDAISGVVLDEEVANMMMYQKSYNASARLMTALDEALDVLINKTGLVGR